ncbi:MAG: PilW family protein, partial [Desulfohalobiaceae bacterium]
MAMVISLLLLGGVYSLFQNSSANYRMQAGLSRIQESGRFAIDFLKRDIRRAGYQGCSSYGPLTNTLKDKDAWAYDFEVAIEGYDNVGSSVADLGGLETLPGTDVVVIRTSIGEGVSIVDNNDSDKLSVQITQEEPNACADDTDRVSGICEGDIVMVSDCKKSRVFQAGYIQVADDRLKVEYPSEDPSGQFSKDAELIKFATIIYFVRDNA